jgi:membrane protein YdbS with pleckstrin-like domain
MNDNGNYQDFPFMSQRSDELSASAPAFPIAVRTLDRLIEKARRFYQSGDFEEVILNAHLMKELFELCVREEYRRQGRNTFRETLRIRIEKKTDLLDYWWDEGIVAFQKIKIGPEIAKMALAAAEEMGEYIASYVDYRAGTTSHAARTAEGSLFHEARADKKVVNSARRAYPVTKGGLQVDDAEVLYLARPSILGCALEYKGFELLLVALLFGSFFVGPLLGISVIGTVLRAISLFLFLFVAGRVVIATYSERYAITTHSIFVEKGLFLKHTAVIPLRSVAKVTKQQGLSGKLSSTGNLNVRTSTGHLLVIKEVYDPDEVCDLITELRRGNEPVTID